MLLPLRLRLVIFVSLKMRMYTDSPRHHTQTHTPHFTLHRVRNARILFEARYSRHRTCHLSPTPTMHFPRTLGCSESARASDDTQMTLRLRSDDAGQREDGRAGGQVESLQHRSIQGESQAEGERALEQVTCSRREKRRRLRLFVIGGVGGVLTPPATHRAVDLQPARKKAARLSTAVCMVRPYAGIYRVCRGGGGGGGGGRSTAPRPLFSASGAHCAASWRCAITRPARRCRFRTSM